MSDSGNRKSDVSQPEYSPWSLWDRYVSGDELCSRQSEMLSDTLKHDMEFRRNALAERSVDQMLRIEAETNDQTESFLAQVLSKCHSAADASLPSPMASQALDAKMLDRALLQNINRDRPNNRRAVGRLFQKNSAWLAMAAVVLVSITGVGFWYQNLYVSNQLDQSLELSSATKKIEAKEESIPQDGSSFTIEHRRNNIAQANSNESNDAAQNPFGDPLEQNQTLLSANSQQVFATVTKAEQLDPSSSIVKGLSLGKESVIISEGELEIAMSGGVKVNVFAPCRLELQSENSLRLIAGELSLEVPNQNTQFQLETPAIAVANTDSAFDIVVEETGRTEVEVRRGGIAVQALDYPNAQAWNLNADATNSLVVYTPEDSFMDGLPQNRESNVTNKVSGPIASFAKSLSGEKIGVITFNGQSRSFDDEVVFSKVREQVFRGVRTPGESLARNWSRFVETAANEPQPTGTIELNGKEYSFDNYNEAVLAQNNVLAQFAPSVNADNSSEQSDGQTVPPVTNNETLRGFQGTLFIRGQRRDFHNFEEYQTALRELMGPAAEFGFFSFGK